MLHRAVLEHVEAAVRREVVKQQEAPRGDSRVIGAARSCPRCLN